MHCTQTGVVRVAALDMDAHPSVGQPYNVKGFPTIKLFGADKANVSALRAGVFSQSMLTNIRS